MVKEAVRSRFDRYEVMCPLEPEMIVLKGAVIMGHMDQPVVGRLARYHYGIALSENILLQILDNNSPVYVSLKMSIPLQTFVQNAPLSLLL
jgi:hypothetical protein